MNALIIEDLSWNIEMAKKEFGDFHHLEFARNDIETKVFFKKRLEGIDVVITDLYLPVEGEWEIREEPIGLLFYSFTRALGKPCVIISESNGHRTAVSRMLEQYEDVWTGIDDNGGNGTPEVAKRGIVCEMRATQHYDCWMVDARTKKLKSRTPGFEMNRTDPEIKAWWRVPRALKNCWGIDFKASDIN